MYMMASSANLVRACARANPGLLAGLAPTRRGALLPVTVPRAAPAHVPRFNSRRQLKASAYMDTRGEKQQKQPGVQKEMKQQPISTENTHRGSGKLEGKVALITGGDSGIGRAIAVAFAREGAKTVICYVSEKEKVDAEETVKLVEKEPGKEGFAIQGDAGTESFAETAVSKVIEKFGKIDILVNNCAEQHTHQTITEITEQELERTFRTNIFSQFFLVQAALPKMSEGGAIINNTSINAYKGNPKLIAYTATKGAISAFTYSLAQDEQVMQKNIRVNAVAPGPIWTPLIPSTFPQEKVESFGQEVPMKRAGQPWEVAMSFVFLASNDSSYMSGQVLHPNGGVVVHG